MWKCNNFLESIVEKKRGIYMDEIIFPLIGIFISVIASFWVYKDAKSRASSHPILWAIGVLAIWLIFLPLYMFFRPHNYMHIQKYHHTKSTILQDHYDENVLADNEYNYCPNCGRKRKNNQRYCGYCGYDFSRMC